jgi:hypothetical protein
MTREKIASTRQSPSITHQTQQVSAETPTGTDAKCFSHSLGHKQPLTRDKIGSGIALAEVLD